MFRSVRLRCYGGKTGYGFVAEVAGGARSRSACLFLCTQGMMFLMKAGWYVLAGGPCAGKTTLLSEFAARGFRTVAEAARAYLDQEFAKGKMLEDIRGNEIEFQNELIRLKMERERTLPRDEVIFFDRGMHDSIPYLSLRGDRDNALLRDAIQGARYDAVFLLDRFPYEKDDVRTETPEEADELHTLLGKAYADAGMPVIRVPRMNADKRADFVLEKIAALSLD